jgi:EmrB/QacA subfamily drug resistance transporter
MPRPSPFRRQSQTAGPWIVLAVVSVAQFMVVLDATIVNVALPSIRRDLRFAAGDLQWVVTSYTLLFGGFLLIGGRAADLFGRRRLFMAGAAVFSAASLLGALSAGAWMLVVFRSLQGLGAALVSPAALSIITTTFAGRAERAKALTVWGAISTAGGAVGLLLGGALTTALSWRWVFLVNVPIGAATLLLAMRELPAERASAARGGFDIAGAASVTAGLVLLVYAIAHAQDAGWSSAGTIAFAAAAIVLLGAFVAIESRQATPLLRPGIFRVGGLSIANGVLLVVAGGLLAMFFFASLYVQEILGYTPLTAGVAFLPAAAGSIIGSSLAPPLIRRVGSKAAAVAGLLIAAGGMALMTRLTPDGSFATDLLPGLLPISVGLGVTLVPLTLIATANIAPAEAGLASGLFNTSQQVGGALGLAVLSTLAAHRTSSTLAALASAPTRAQQAAALVDGYQLAFAVAATLLAVGALMMLLLLRGRDLAGPTRDSTIAGRPQPEPVAAG